MRNILSYNEFKNQKIYEAFKAEDFSKVLKLLLVYLKKNLGELFECPGLEIFKTSIESDYLMGVRYFLKDGKSFRINWLRDDDKQKIHSVDFWELNDPVAKQRLICGNESIAYIAPLIVAMAKSPSKKIDVKKYIEKESLVENYIINEAVSVKEVQILIRNIKRKEERTIKKGIENGLVEPSEGQNEIQNIRLKYNNLRNSVTADNAQELYNQLSGETVVTAKVQPGSKEEDATPLVLALQKKVDNMKYADVKTVYEDLEKLVHLILTHQVPSLLVTGMPGTGKSWNIEKQIRKFGLKEITVQDEINGDFQSGDFYIMKGSSTPAAFYETLYKCREKLVIADDCDDILRNKEGINLLKGALEAEGRRVISWNRKGKKFDDEDAAPPRFEFKGELIFISNMHESQIDRAVLSRSLTLDVTLRASDIIYKIKSILENILPEMIMTQKQEVLDIFEEEREKPNSKLDVSIRTFVLACKIRSSGISDYARIIKYQCQKR